MLGTSPPAVVARLGAVLAMVFYAVACSAEARMEQFNVPEQQAITGIPEFARQADIQILVPERDVRGVRTNEVVGTFTVRAALDRLLTGTNLSVISADNQTVTLRTALESATAPGGATVVVAQAVPATAPTSGSPGTAGQHIRLPGTGRDLVVPVARKRPAHLFLQRKGAAMDRAAARLPRARQRDLHPLRTPIRMLRHAAAAGAACAEPLPVPSGACLHCPAADSWRLGRPRSTPQGGWSCGCK